MSKIQLHNGVTFHYKLLNGRGEACPVVFVSGYTGSMAEWDAYAQALATNGHPVLTFDNQGSGQTIDNGEPLTVEAMAFNIHALLSELGMAKSIIITFAWGGCIAQQLAYSYPGCVARLGLISPVMRFSDKAISICELLALCREKEQWHEYAMKIYETCYSYAWKKENPQDEFIESLIDFLPAAQTEVGQRRQVEALKAFDSRGWAHEITVPIHILSPAEDQLILTEESGALVQDKPSSHFLIMNETGHDVFTEAPGSVLRFILDVTRKEG